MERLESRLLQLNNSLLKLAEHQALFYKGRYSVSDIPNTDIINILKDNNVKNRAYSNALQDIKNMETISVEADIIEEVKSQEEIQSELSEHTESETPTIVTEPEVSTTNDNLSMIIEEVPEAEVAEELIESQDPLSETILKTKPNDADIEQKKDVVSTSTKLVSADYQCDTDDFYVGVNSNNPTKITLPLNPKDGAMMVIKAEMQSLHSNKKITIVTGDDSFIDGSTRYFISKPYGVARLMYRDGNWYGV